MSHLYFMSFTSFVGCHKWHAKAKKKCVEITRNDSRHWCLSVTTHTKTNVYGYFLEAAHISTDLLQIKLAKFPSLYVFYVCEWIICVFVFANSNCPLREDWSSSNITLPPPLFRRTIVGRHDHVFIQTVHRRLYSIINCWWRHYNAQRKNVLLTTVVSLSYKK